MSTLKFLETKGATVKDGLPSGDWVVNQELGRDELGQMKKMFTDISVLLETFLFMVMLVNVNGGGSVMMLVVVEARVE